MGRTSFIRHLRVPSDAQKNQWVFGYSLGLKVKYLAFASLMISILLFTSACRPERPGSLGTTTSSTNGSDTLIDEVSSNLRYSPEFIFVSRGNQVSSAPIDATLFSSYSITPNLPAGISLDSTTGVISGLAAATSTQTTYTITGVGETATETASLTLAVLAPNSATSSGFFFKYPQASVSLTQNSSVSISPTLGATPLTQFTAALPAGLNINSTTGVISGSPTTMQSQTAYTIIASHSNGTASFDLNITVTQALPPWYKLSAGHEHTCAIIGSTAKCWGRDWAGQIGDAIVNSSSNLSPTTVSVLSNNVTQVTAGRGHSCAVAEGAAYCWGRNFYGNLGRGEVGTTAKEPPAQVLGLSSQVTQISAGYSHTCAVVNGAVKCWGSDYYGQLGDNTSTNSDFNSTPIDAIGLDSGVTQVDAGGYWQYGRSCAIKNQSAYCWGSNIYGNLGFASPGYSGITVPTQVPGLETGVQHISVGILSTCAIQNGNAKCWGENSFGQLGDGTSTTAYTPTSVLGLASGATTQISTGFSHTCAVVGGAAKCWGSNDYGQLGTGNNYYTANGYSYFYGTGSSTPVQVSGLETNVVAVSTSKYSYGTGNYYGYGHSCALLADESVKCWGYAGGGQLGIGNSGDSFDYSDLNYIKLFPTSIVP